MLGGWVHEGCRPFKNDDAFDWVVDWVEADDLSPARDALLEAVLADEYLEAPGREGESWRGIVDALRAHLEQFGRSSL